MLVNDMKILIMCGGRGKRLGKVTADLPKPLIKITHDHTVLEVKIREYLRQGFQAFILCIGYKGELIRQEIAQLALDAQFTFSDAGPDAGILARLAAARDLFTEQVIMTYGDTYTDIDLDRLIAAHQQRDNEATIVAGPIENPFGLVEFNHENKVTYFKEKPVLNYYIGYAIINKSAFDLIPPKIITMPDGQGLVTFYKILIALNKLGVYYHPGIQVTFNTPEELADARDKMIRFYSTSEVHA